MDLTDELFQAALRGDSEAVRDLVKQGADVNAVDIEDGDSPIHRAAGAGHVAAIRALIAAGADVNKADGIQGATPLLFALAFGHAEAVIELLQHGADPYVEDGAGRNAFDRAAARDFQGEWGKLYEYYDQYYNPIIK